MDAVWLLPDTSYKGGVGLADKFFVAMYAEGKPLPYLTHQSALRSFNWHPSLTQNRGVYPFSP